MADSHTGNHLECGFTPLETYSKMRLRKLLLLAKMRSEFCLEIFVIEDTTCFLTVPPYSGRVFKGIFLRYMKPFRKGILLFAKVYGACPSYGRWAGTPPWEGFLVAKSGGRFTLWPPFPLGASSKGLPFQYSFPPCFPLYSELLRTPLFFPPSTVGSGHGSVSRSSLKSSLK
ncbi:hypothetical protein Tco_1168474 [Tanacetum coccineum]